MGQVIQGGCFGIIAICFLHWKLGTFAHSLPLTPDSDMEAPAEPASGIAAQGASHEFEGEACPI
jgi:hypothetical protein